MNWDNLFSQRVTKTADETVVKILKLSEQPDVISLAGGLPDPSIFMVDEFKEIADAVMTDSGTKALGYGAIAGLTSFREALVRETIRMGRPTNLDEVMVTTGGLAAIDLISKVLVDPGDVVIVGAPTFTAALHVFRSYEAEMVGIPLDEEGINPDLLEDALKDIEKRGKRAKFIYAIPSFQNPMGVTIPESRRRKIVKIASKYGVPILEDTAYRQIRFEGDAPPMMAEMDTDNVILVSTLSKTLNPGLRLGWVAAQKKLIDALVVAKQGQDQCSSTIGQLVAEQLLDKGFMQKQTVAAIDVYRKKRDAMVSALEKYMPEGVTWTYPNGGFFIWLTFPERIDTLKELDNAVAIEKVAYVPGSAFHFDREMKNSLRLCYSYVSEQKIDEGIKRLSAFFKKLMERNY